MFSIRMTLLLLLTVTPFLVSSNVHADNDDQTRYSEHSDRADELIKNGLTLHDRGDFVAAVAAYEEALREDPGNIYALYEMTLSYLKAGNYQKAHVTARRGMGNRSPLVSELYSLSATALDNMGKPREAVLEFIQALKLYPDNHSLNLNLAVTYARLGEFENAQAAAAQTIRVTPDHPSAHFILGQLYAHEKRKVPALMAFGRFLTLEPNSNRTQTALEVVSALLERNFKIGEDGSPVVVMDVGDIVDPNGTDSGYKRVAAQLKLVAATAAVTQKKNNDASLPKSPEYYSMTILSSLLSQYTSYPDDFAKRHYLPFYLAIEDNDYNHAFARLTLASLDPGGASDWMKSNKDVFAEFTKWSRGYSEPVSE